MDKKIMEILRENRDVALATALDGKPYVRVFQIMKIDGNGIYFATSPHKEVYGQLRKNPQVEILVLDGTCSVRVAGVMRFDVTDTIQREIYETNHVLSRLYENYTDLVYMRLQADMADYFDLRTTPPLFIHYDF